jgi:chitin synthase
MSEVPTRQPLVVQNSIDLSSTQPTRRRIGHARGPVRRGEAGALLDGRRTTSRLKRERCRVPLPSEGHSFQALPETLVEPEPHVALTDDACVQSSVAIEGGFKNVFCMTLYNEPFEFLQRSLSALIASIEAQEPGFRATLTKSCVVIIADGRDRADPDILQFFRDAGLMDAGSSFPALGETIHLSRQRAGDIMAALGASGQFRREVSFAVCVKNQNRGKLHSHALFFQSICPVLRPDLVYQLDAGTVVEAGAVSKLVEYMADEPDVAAAASRILTPTPRGTASTLSVWQYMDFVMQKAVTWPTEVASGYLSVIPGQFCVFRWSAVSAPSSEAGGERPLDTYLRGLNAIAPLERVMFLAEDRVFGNEIVLARDKSWRIGYCAAAEATTDACDTFGELLRQRRRWQNSALAVRLWLWGQVPAYLARSDKSAFDKARFTASMVWQGLLTLSEVVSPVAVLVLLFAAAGGVIHPRSAAAVATVSGTLVAAGGLAWLTFANRNSRWQRWLCLARDTAAALAVASLLGFAFYVNPFNQAALLIAPVVLMAVVITASMPGQRWAALRHLPLFLLTDRLISFALYGYALANVNNVTWGTKGLTDEAGDQANEKRRMRRLRNIVAGSIVAIDLALIAALLDHPDVWIKSETSVIEIFTLPFLVVAGFAAAVWALSVRSTLRSFWKAAVAAVVRGHTDQASEVRPVLLPNVLGR